MTFCLALPELLEELQYCLNYYNLIATKLLRLSDLMMSKIFRIHLSLAKIKWKFNIKILASVVQGVQANVSLTVLRELELLIPQKVTLDKFNRQIAEYIKLIQLNRAENQHLKQQRFDSQTYFRCSPAKDIENCRRSVMSPLHELTVQKAAIEWLQSSVIPMWKVLN